jgi:hypothetical protein
MSNFEEFVENVKAGKVEGLEFLNERVLLGFGGMTFVIAKPYYDEEDSPSYGEWFWDESNKDTLCAHIRRWLTGKGYKRPLDDDHLALFRKEDENEGPRFLFTEGSELDWHIDAANWVCKQGVEG